MGDVNLSHSAATFYGVDINNTDLPEAIQIFITVAAGRICQREQGNIRVSLVNGGLNFCILSRQKFTLC